MHYRTPALIASTACIAAFGLSACGSGTNTSASNSTSSISTAAASSATTTQTEVTPSSTTSAAPRATMTSEPSTASTAPSAQHSATATVTHSAAATQAVQMGGNCGKVGKSFTVYASSDISCPFAMNVVKQLVGGTPASVTAYSPKLKRNITVSCVVGARGNSVCETPSGGWVNASIRG